jgi:TPR repeat protein
MGIDGVLDKNLGAAYEYFETAMKSGNTDAYVHLSNMYANGIYVKKDEKLARELLMMAATKKNQTAIYILNEKVRYRVK